MKPNRSIPASTVIPVLIYPDVREAVAWLGAAFGFAERVRIGEDHRAQLAFGDGAVIVGDVGHDRRPPRPGEVTHSVTVRVENVAAHYERSRDHGARIIMEPTDFEYGERQYTAQDLAGHRWTFSETLADVAPEDWGGTSVATG
ncbi:VOC family protein [Streptomyces sp. NBC_00988]|uniref:VOC family protein n=1 Tax=Streptomyces sp. NBC_00988 TaxID=2903704 RepID=UPI00386487B8|nr:VOC family protein [Streptomyces sp. NBC_00988]